MSDTSGPPLLETSGNIHSAYDTHNPFAGLQQRARSALYTGIPPYLQAGQLRLQTQQRAAVSLQRAKRAGIYRPHLRALATAAATQVPSVSEASVSAAELSVGTFNNNIPPCPLPSEPTSHEVTDDAATSEASAATSTASETTAATTTTTATTTAASEAGSTTMDPPSPDSLTYHSTVTEDECWGRLLLAASQYFQQRSRFAAAAEGSTAAAAALQAVHRLEGELRDATDALDAYEVTERLAAERPAAAAAAASASTGSGVAGGGGGNPSHASIAAERQRTTVLGPLLLQESLPTGVTQPAPPLPQHGKSADAARPALLRPRAALLLAANVALARPPIAASSVATTAEAEKARSGSAKGNGSGASRKSTGAGTTANAGVGNGQRQSIESSRAGGGGEACGPAAASPVTDALRRATTQAQGGAGTEDNDGPGGGSNSANNVRPVCGVGGRWVVRERMRRALALADGLLRHAGMAPLLQRELFAVALVVAELQAEVFATPTGVFTGLTGPLAEATAPCRLAAAARILAACAVAPPLLAAAVPPPPALRNSAPSTGGANENLPPSVRAQAFSAKLAAAHARALRNAAGAAAAVAAAAAVKKAAQRGSRRGAEAEAAAVTAATTAAQRDAAREQYRHGIMVAAAHLAATLSETERVKRGGKKGETGPAERVFADWAPALGQLPDVTFGGGGISAAAGTVAVRLNGMMGNQEQARMDARIGVTRALLAAVAAEEDGGGAGANANAPVQLHPPPKVIAVGSDAIHLVLSRAAALSALRWSVAAHVIQLTHGSVSASAAADDGDGGDAAAAGEGDSAVGDAGPSTGPLLLTPMCSPALKAQYAMPDAEIDSFIDTFKRKLTDSVSSEQWRGVLVKAREHTRVVALSFTVGGVAAEEALLRAAQAAPRMELYELLRDDPEWEGQFRTALRRHLDARRACWLSCYSRSRLEAATGVLGELQVELMRQGRSLVVVPVLRGLSPDTDPPMPAPARSGRDRRASDDDYSYDRYGGGSYGSFEDYDDYGYGGYDGYAAFRERHGVNDWRGRDGCGWRGAPSRQCCGVALYRTRARFQRAVSRLVRGILVERQGEAPQAEQQAGEQQHGGQREGELQSGQREETEEGHGVVEGQARLAGRGEAGQQAERAQQRGPARGHGWSSWVDLEEGPCYEPREDWRGEWGGEEDEWDDEEEEMRWRAEERWDEEEEERANEEWRGGGADGNGDDDAPCTCPRCCPTGPLAALRPHWRARHRAALNAAFCELSGLGRLSFGTADDQDLTRTSSAAAAASAAAATAAGGNAGATRTSAAAGASVCPECGGDHGVCDGGEYDDEEGDGDWVDDDGGFGELRMSDAGAFLESPDARCVELLVVECRPGQPAALLAGQQESQ